MNIKNRLQKLESHRGAAGVCQCVNVPRYEMYRADLSIDSESAEPILDGKPIPEVCNFCRRPIEKTKLILQYVDQTTKDRFPEEWNANRNK